MRLVCGLVLLLGGLQLACALLRVGAWNVQTFGPKKANLPGVPNSPPDDRKAAILIYIAVVIGFYDIIVIQEVRDKDGAVMKALMTEVNKVAPKHCSTYSEPLSRRPNSNYKERYLYIYNTATVNVLGTRQYVPPHPRTFSRPPYLAKFQSRADPTLEFVLIPQHTSPTWAACKEIDALVDVVDYVNTQWGPQGGCSPHSPPLPAPLNILVLGDFNAACTYVSEEDWEDIRLHTQRRDFQWLIDDSMNTAVGQRQTPNKPCAYDRIVANNAIMPRVVGGIAQVIDFELQWGLPSPAGVQVKAKEVSDHFIVEVALQ